MGPTTERLACQKKYEDDIRKSYLSRKIWLYQEARLFFKCAACLQKTSTLIYLKAKPKKIRKLSMQKFFFLNMTNNNNDMIYAFFVNF